MKKMRFILPLLAVLIVVGASAFTHYQTPKAATLTEAWFYYDGVGDKDDPDSYSPAGEIPGCNSDVSLCAIQATVDPNNSNRPLAMSSDPNAITLATLADESDGFQHPVTGVVRFKD